MELKSYLDLYALLKEDRSSASQRRAFGLEHKELQEDPAAQLEAWTQAHRQRLTPPLLSDKVDHLLYMATLLLAAIAFVVGLFSGVGLLSYSGKEPVNLVYFLSMVVFLPLVTMSMTLFAMMRANRTKNLLVHISPAFWMERIVTLVFKKEEEWDTFAFNPRVFNWLIIKRSQLLALAFSVGLLVALLGVVATRDIAFAWSTTLELSDTQFHTFLETIALPWKVWLPSAVPSLELVAQSHYFRLGGKLSETMVAHAALLGTWWKFLAMATLFYAVVLRSIFYLLASWGLKRALREALLTLEGATLLLRDMNEPLVSTRAQDEEPLFAQPRSDYARLVTQFDGHYDHIHGWSLSKAQLGVICDALGISASECKEVGGNNTLETDRKIVEKSSGDVLLLVKAWEPPTMDFVDHLLLLASKATKVTVAPIGTDAQGFTPSPKEVAVWVRKIAALDQSNVWIKQ